MKPTTKVVHIGRPTQGAGGQPVNPPIMRASTILFPSISEYESAERQKYKQLCYGRHGTTTSAALEEAVADLEGGYRCIALPSGLAAISAALLAFARPNSHLLIADNVYGPTRNLCEKYLRSIDVHIEYFGPGSSNSLTSLLRSNTCAIYCESPGTSTFEIHDMPAVKAALGGREIPIINDNTWATPYLYRSFEKGVDISVHAATKYIVGHSDAVLGLVVCNERYWERVRTIVGLLGYSTSPDDCYLALRGLRTLPVRLERHQKSALKIARWLATHHLISEVYYPPLETDPHHELWARDFSGASGLMGFRFRSNDRRAAVQFCDGLKLFGIGASWGGYESLALLSKPVRSVTPNDDDGILVRLHIGLEDSEDLIADLSRSLSSIASGAR